MAPSVLVSSYYIAIGSVLVTTDVVNSSHDAKSVWLHQRVRGVVRARQKGTDLGKKVSRTSSKLWKKKHTNQPF
jgi:hypothetical protein